MQCINYTHFISGRHTETSTTWSHTNNFLSNKHPWKSARKIRVERNTLRALTEWMQPLPAFPGKDKYLLGIPKARPIKQPRKPQRIAAFARTRTAFHLLRHLRNNCLGCAEHLSCFLHCWMVPLRFSQMGRGILVQPGWERKAMGTRDLMMASPGVLKPWMELCNISLMTQFHGLQLSFLV